MGELTREWWTTEEKFRASAIMGVVGRAREADEPREQAMLEDLSLYIGREVTQLDAYTYGYRRARDKDNDPRLPLARSIVDTVHAKIAKDIPRTVPLTENGTWTMQRQAKLIEAFIEGVKSRNGWRKAWPVLVRDAMILQNSAVKVYSEVVDRGEKGEHGRIRVDRVLPWEIRVDPIEATYGKPRSLFYECTVDRHVAMEAWPKQAAAIAKAKRVESGTSYHTHADQVRIIEAYHLPSAKGAGDGTKTVICEGVSEVLEEEEWTRDHFPFAVMAWSPPLMGYWGHSLVNDIAGLHITLNEVDEVIRDRMRQSVGFFITDSPEFELEISNDTAIPIFKVPAGMVTSEQARYESPTLVNNELLGERESLIEKGYRFAGVSQLSAQAMKPSGLDAAVALREYQDIESERFSVAQRAAEAFDLDVSRLILTEATTLAEGGIDVEVPSERRRRRKRVLERIKFSAINLDEDAYELQVYPASQLPRQPHGRLAMVEQLIAAGFLDKQNAMRLLDLPDVEGVMSEQLAPYYIVLDMIEAMIEDGERIDPIPEMDLQLADQITSLAILQGTMDKLPEDRMGLLRGFKASIGQLMKRAQQEAAQQQAAQQGAFMPNAAGQLQAGMAQGALPQGQAAVG